MTTSNNTIVFPGGGGGSSSTTANTISPLLQFGTDDSGASIVRSRIFDSLSGTFSGWTYEDVNGNVIAAPANFRPNQDYDYVTRSYNWRVTTAGTGYVVDDVVQEVRTDAFINGVFQSTTSSFYNLTQRAAVAAFILADGELLQNAADANIEREVLLDNNGGVRTAFLRTSTIDETGVQTNVLNTGLDGVTAYATTGVIEPITGGFRESVITFIDVNGLTRTPFLRHYRFDPLTATNVTVDTELDGTTAYTVVGSEELASAGSLIEDSEVLFDENGGVTAEFIRYYVNTDGVRTAVDTALDGVTAYTVVGNVSKTITRDDLDSVILYDTGAGNTAFQRRYARNPLTGVITSADTELDGVTAFVVSAEANVAAINPDSSLSAEFNTTLPTYTSGDKVTLQTDENGQLFVRITKIGVAYAEGSIPTLADGADVDSYAFDQRNRLLVNTESPKIKVERTMAEGVVAALTITDNLDYLDIVNDAGTGSYTVQYNGSIETVDTAQGRDQYTLDYRPGKFYEQPIVITPIGAASLSITQEAS